LVAAAAAVVCVALEVGDLGLGFTSRRRRGGVERLFVEAE